MVVGHKEHQRQWTHGYKKILNKQDPLDRLILDLGNHGVLDVSVVDIPDEPQEKVYDKKPVPRRGKHSS